MQSNVFNGLKHRPAFFLDLVDPSSRSAEDILAMLEVLPGFEAVGPTHLGLNQNEANILMRLRGLSPDKAHTLEESSRQAEALHDALGIDTVVIHARAYAVSASAAGVATMAGPVCARPVKSTGAGDRFNAGYAAGLLLGLEPTLRLRLATATSGLYVRLGRSPDVEELADFCASWESGKLEP